MLSVLRLLKVSFTQQNILLEYHSSKIKWSKLFQFHFIKLHIICLYISVTVKSAILVLLCQSIKSTIMFISDQYIWTKFFHCQGSLAWDCCSPRTLEIKIMQKKKLLFFCYKKSSCFLWLPSMLVFVLRILTDPSAFDWMQGLFVYCCWSFV